ncbi:hypothetical protein LWI28_009083 [Acer negundo]|uniref:Protein FAR1-RELATED SEQUENCE n=1 Tax=Acer negundo TaxID=4023 RepID=A0AAD5IZ64_ACENE|nr:hypothetical protein LWI28_009083 [Acer negundo]
MDGITPKAIITDQDRAMKNAIAIVFPTTRHRFCLWHILNKVTEKLGSYGSNKTGMKSALMKSVYNSQSVEEFETTGSREHTQDVKAKLYGMIDFYRANQGPSSMTQTGSNVGCTRGDATTVGGSEQVLNPNVVRGKGRPPSLRRTSRMENDM